MPSRITPEARASYDRLYDVVKPMEKFSSEEMMAFFRATRHFQMWDTIRMKHATDAATPQATDVLKFFEDRFVRTVYKEFQNLNKELTAEDKAAEKKEETTEETTEKTTEKTAEDTADEAPPPKRQATGSSSPKAE